MLVYVWSIFYNIKVHFFTIKQIFQNKYLPDPVLFVVDFHMKYIVGSLFVRLLCGFCYRVVEAPYGRSISCITLLLTIRNAPGL